MDPAELAFAGVVRQAELVRSKEVSPRELVELYLERIERLDPKLDAFRTVYSETAIEAAHAAEEQVGDDDAGPLNGVPIAVKDNLDVAGDATGHGTAAFGGPAAEDSEVVKRLRGAGAILIGKTRLSELAMYPFTVGAPHTTHNPWDTARSPGGSSGGSGAAVAAGLAPAGTASDGGGSIRVPASFCGLFGLKPQRGRVSLMPYPEHWFGLSVAGVLTRSVADSALLMDVLSGPAPGDAHTPPAPDRPFVEAARAKPGKLRIALSTKPSGIALVDKAEKRAAHETADLLRSLGHEVVEASPRYGDILHLFLPRYHRGLYEDAGAMPHPERMERRSRAMARIGGLTRPSLVHRARRSEAKLARRMDEFFADHDVLLTPTTAVPAIQLKRVEGRGFARSYMEAAGIVPFLTPWNLTGQPAAAVPAGFNDRGLPLSSQLVGRANDEATLLSLAAQMEAERPWADRRPPIS